MGITRASGTDTIIQMRCSVNLSSTTICSKRAECRRIRMKVHGISSVSIFRLDRGRMKKR